MKYINKLTTILVMMTLIGCKDSKKEIPTDTVLKINSIVNLSNEQLKNAVIETGVLEKRKISTILRVNGKIDVPPQNMISISVPFGGYLKSTHLLPGMHIHKGEILATIEDQQYVQFQQDYLLAKSKVKYLQAEYIRQKELNQTKAVSDKAFQQAESDYNSQKIIIKSFYEKLKLMQLDPDKLDEGSITRSINIYSPIEGVVSKVNANIGKYIPATDVLFELINPSDIHLNFTVFEKDIDKLYVGQKVVAFNNHKANEKYICEILLISSDLKPDRTAEVHCHFEEYNKTLLPGMYMNAEIALQSENALSLPDDAILLFENEKYIFIEKDKNNYELTKVVVGASQDGFTIIESPKNIENKKIVVKGAYTLLMKMKNVSEE